MANLYEVPSWAGKPPSGHHLDVTKDEKLIQKLMIDEKKCYLFGRNPQLNDFCIDHGSCSRVHAALVYHKHLNISYLVDLGSTHGTFIGNFRIEANKPTQLQINSTFHFGASTRFYILRERPTIGSRSVNIMEDIPMTESSDGALLGLPECQTELDNLTEYNTAHNRRISMLGISDDGNIKKSGNKPKRKRRIVTFNEEEIVINPEDIDPAVGRFRNLIQTTVVPTKKIKYDNNMVMHGSSPGTDSTKHMHPSTYISQMYSDFQQPKHLHPPGYISSLYHDLPPVIDNDNRPISGTGNAMDIHNMDMGGGASPNMVSKLGLILPNPAPDVAPTVVENTLASQVTGSVHVAASKNAKKSLDEHLESSNEPKKKKYAKEAWPGRKPLLSSF